jgi:hypothetical protein
MPGLGLGLGLGSGIYTGVGLGFLGVGIAGSSLASFCWGVLNFLSKCLGLVVHFSFKSIKFYSWHQNITGKI